MNFNQWWRHFGAQDQAQAERGLTPSVALVPRCEEGLRHCLEGRIVEEGYRKWWTREGNGQDYELAHDIVCTGPRAHADQQINLTGIRLLTQSSVQAPRQPFPGWRLVGLSLWKDSFNLQHNASTLWHQLLDSRNTEFNSAISLTTPLIPISCCRVFRSTLSIREPPMSSIRMYQLMVMWVIPWKQQRIAISIEHRHRWWRRAARTVCRVSWLKDAILDCVIHHNYALILALQEHYRPIAIKCYQLQKLF